MEGGLRPKNWPDADGGLTACLVPAQLRGSSPCCVPVSVAQRHRRLQGQCTTLETPATPGCWCEGPKLLCWKLCEKLRSNCGGLSRSQAVDSHSTLTFLGHTD